MANTYTYPRTKARCPLRNTVRFYSHAVSSSEFDRPADRPMPPDTLADQWLAAPQEDGGGVGWMREWEGVADTPVSIYVPPATVTPLECPTLELPSR